MSDGLKTVVVGEFRVEVKSEHWVGIHDNYWAQVVGPKGVYARFGRPVPAYPGQEARRVQAERDALAYIQKLKEQL